MRFIPVSEPKLSGNELRYVTECIETSWISSAGKFVTAFEDAFAAFCGTRHGLAVSNGTVALHLGIEALGIGPGDEVIVPDLTFAASANAVIHAGATPVLVDADPRTWNMDPARVEEAVTPRTKAIMAVHLYGNPCDMDALLHLKEKYGLFLIEDAAEAAGATFHGKRVGAFSDFAAYSFFGNKTITSGEGGMCVTDDEALLKRMRVLRDHGMNPEKRYWHDVVGYNYRLTNVQAAIGLAQLEQIEGFILRKREIAAIYRDNLDPELFTLAKVQPGSEHTYWLNSVLLPEQVDRDEVIRQLRARDIDARPVFYPLHEMPPFRQGDRRFPVTVDLSYRGISLPSGVPLTNEEVAYVAESMQDIVEGLYSRAVPDYTAA